MERQWTPEQQTAINADGGTLLVSAAAGSGKTAVLVERVIQRMIREENPIPADRFLMVTFSNAAASEMRGRIEESLLKELRKNPENLSLRRQKTLLSQASITTVHAFCLRLVREYFQKLELSPDFRVGEESELSALRQDAINEVLESFYDLGENDFLSMVELFSNGRDDRAVADLFLRLANFLENLPFPEKWLADQLDSYDHEKNPEKSLWGQTILSYSKDALTYCVDLCKGTLTLLRENGDSFEKLEIFLRERLGILEEISRNLEKNWDKARVAILDYEKGRFPTPKGYKDDPIILQIKEMRGSIDDVIGKQLIGKWQYTQSDFSEDMKNMRPIVETLFTGVLSYRTRYMEKKREAAVLDFSDLEHFALELLLENGEKSSIAKEISQKYDAVMVDEYQDSNEIQDLIFRLVSEEEKNLFLVGDVKQSIYGFRGAKPEIFARRRIASYEYNGKDFPASIHLGKNFRSREGICDGVNQIFSPIMSTAIGGTNYDERESLQAGATFPKIRGFTTHVVLVEKEKEEAARKKEAEAIAFKVNKMILEGIQVTDEKTKELRSVAWRDFAILLRSRTHAAAYEEALSTYGIPVWSDLSRKFFSSKEVLYLLSLLKIIDNPLWEVELCSAMMSPIFGFSPDEMAELRLESRDKALYLIVEEAAKKGNIKCQFFIETLTELRRFSALASVDRLIEKALSLTEFDLMVSAMPGGEGRLSNIHFMIDRARSYEASSAGGLSGFNRMMSKLVEEGQDLSRTLSLPEGENVVKIMTMHRSKGLEYPVVFIAGMAGRFNRRDLSNFYLFDDTLGFASKYKNPKTLHQYSTLPREAIRIKKEEELLSEEMRTLYVALTRAKEHLYLYGTFENVEKKVRAITSLTGGTGKVAPFVLKSATSTMEWALMALLKRPESNAFRMEMGLATVSGISNENVEILLDHQKNEQSIDEEEIKEKIAADPDIVVVLKERLEYQYEYEALTKRESKMGASEEAENQENMQDEHSELLLKKPYFLPGGRLSPVERGNAFHTFMEFVDFEKAAAAPEEEIARLKAGGFLTADEAKVIEPKKMKKLFSGAVGKRLMASPKVWREMKFIVAANENDHEEDASMIQGIADCVFVEENQVVILDYKTDYTKDGEDLKTRYALQLAIYQKAVGQITGLPVKECLLYSFHLGKALVYSREELEIILDRRNEM